MNAKYLDAISFKGLGADPMTAALAGGGAATAAVDGGLNANGCNGSGTGYVCFDFPSNYDRTGLTNLTFDLVTTGAFDLTGNPHLKLLWLDANGKKAGSLYSQDIPFSHTTSVVPEPATWALMIGGFGLAGATLRRRREVLAAA